jgi:U3 small nucleolar RNA-associated protein 14
VSKVRPKRKTETATIRSVRFADVDLNEDDSVMSEGEKSGGEGSVEDEEEEDGDPSEFIDVLDVLDGKGSPDSGDGESISLPSASKDDAEDTAGHSSEDEGSEDAEVLSEDQDIVLSADEEVNHDALEGLGRFVSTLDTSRKRKAENVDPAEGAPRQKPRIVSERTEAGAENEFAAHISGVLSH